MRQQLERHLFITLGEKAIRGDTKYGLLKLPSCLLKRSNLFILHALYKLLADKKKIDIGKTPAQNVLL